VKALGRGSIASFIKIALEIIWVLLWIAAIAIGLGALAYGVTWLGVSLGWWPADIFGRGGEITVDGGAVEANARASFSLDQPQLALPALVAAAVMVAGGLLIVKQLRTLFANFTSGEPFRQENAHCLRVIWVTLLVVELSRMFLGVATGAVIAAVGLPADNTLRVDVRIAVSTWVAIVILIVLAEVFREGARMKAEQDLTI
jgi:hypothetical protein